MLRGVDGEFPCPGTDTTAEIEDPACGWGYGEALEAELEYLVLSI